MSEWSEWKETVEQAADSRGTCVILVHSRTRDTGDGSPVDRQTCSARGELPGDLDDEGNPKQSVAEIVDALRAKVVEARGK